MTSDKNAKPLATGSTVAASRLSSTGSSSNIWQAVVEQAKHRDAELVDGWQRSMDVLLLFVRERVIA